MSGKLTTISTVMLAAAMLVLFACESDDGERRFDDGDGGADGDGDGDGDGDTDGDSDGDGDSDADESCDEVTQYVYLVDSNKSLYKFDPPAKNFELIGKLNCQAGQATPFSMSVARSGTAYVLYSGALGGCAGIYPVSVKDASCGAKTGYTCGTEGFGTFGMGFATLDASTDIEELYVGTKTQLGVLDIGNWSITPKGNLAGNPEFTGNAKGELWGFFPSTTPPKVAQVDKSTGGTTLDWPLAGMSNDASAWAFAHWGGSYYIFYEATTDNSTNVYKVTDGVMENYMMNTGKRIVGAGVSTCAPIAPPV